MEQQELYNSIQALERELNEKRDELKKIKSKKSFGKYRKKIGKIVRYCKAAEKHVFKTKRGFRRVVLYENTSENVKVQLQQFNPKSKYLYTRTFNILKNQPKNYNNDPQLEEIERAFWNIKNFLKGTESVKKNEFRLAIL